MNLGFPFEKYVYLHKKIGNAGESRPRYRLNVSFGNVMRAARLLKDDTISVRARVNAALRLMLKLTAYRRTAFLVYTDKVKLLNSIFDLLGAGGIREAALNDDKRPLSLETDGVLIYGAFLQIYGIDLHKNNIDWREFCVLLSCMPDNTVLMNIVRIRTMEMPENASEKETERIYALKRLYAVGGNSSASGDYCGGLDVLFERLAGTSRQ